MAEKLLKARKRKIAAKKGAEKGAENGAENAAENGAVGDAINGGNGRGRSPSAPNGRAASTKPPQAIALVGTYREKQLAWIKKNGVYNYPVKEGDEFDAAAFGKIKELWLYAGSKGKRHCFAAAFVCKMTREEFLAAYPTYADIGRASVAPSGRASVSSSGRASVAPNGRAVSTKPPHDESAPKDKISLLIKSENREYYVFKASFLDYGPKLDNPQVVIRAMDFATGRGRARLVKKAFDQFTQDGEFAPLAAYLPSALSAIPRQQLRVCDSGVRLHVWSPVKGMTPEQEKIESIVMSIATFGRNREMSVAKAYDYLCTYAGLNFLDEHYSITRCYSDEMMDESLSKVCRNNGGLLK